MHFPTRKDRPSTGHLRSIALCACAGTVVLCLQGPSIGARLSPVAASGSIAGQPRTAYRWQSGPSRQVTARSAGRHGHWRSVTIGNPELDGITCPSTRVCYAFGGTGNSAATWRTTIFGTKDAGKTWQTNVIHPSGIPFFHLICPSVRVCYAVGVIPTEGVPSPPGISNDIVTTRDGGQTWRTVFTSDVARIRSGACRAPSLTCVYAGNIVCPTVSICYALGFGPPVAPNTLPTSSVLLTTIDGGRSWSRRAVDVVSGTAAIACPAITTCYIAGSVTAVTADRGATWRKRPGGPRGYVGMITCPAVQVCYTVGFRSASKGTAEAGTIAVTADGGRTWHTSYSLAFRANGISCPTARICYAAGRGMSGSRAGVLVTRDGGTSWQRESPKGGMVEEVRGIACPGPSICYAVAGHGTMYLRS